MTVNRVLTGRTYDRRQKLCPGCKARLTLGEPKAADDSVWWQRLTLTAEQRDLLLVAAAEYRQLCEEAGEYQDCVEFVDWISPSVVDKKRSV